eukprot:CAMPEP_0119073148 /NCGR_PEP_ID=MMETSP1178-20130426/62731_1 /TAXON_ID=33656 /ORGANISM="unid sp, Strain CCMP2000" /LENGTH=812 /DNA_ID=CAMNT_0007055209 /DNA_START=3 /DNA_END=2441 /DNA_ORIENTATION=+
MAKPPETRDEKIDHETTVSSSPEPAILGGKPVLRHASVVAPVKKSRHRILIALGVMAVFIVFSATALGVVLATRVNRDTKHGSNATLTVVFDTFTGCNHLLTSLRVTPGYHPSEYLQLSDRYQDVGGGIDRPVFATSDGVAESGAPRSGGGGGGAESYSTTNVQVEGIDESDLVKNDGTHIYSVGGSQLVIVRAHPADAKAVISRTELNVGGGFEIFAAEEALLHGGVLLVLSAVQQLAEHGGRFASVVAQTWSVSDPAAPALLRQLTIEGGLATARLVGSVAYVAVSTAPRMLNIDLPTAAAELKDEDTMPRIDRGGGGGPEPAAMCSGVAYVAEVQPRSLLVLASIALPSGEMVHRTVVATGSAYREASVVASASSLYVATYNSAWTCDAQHCDGWWCGWWGGGDCSFRSLTALAAFDLADGAIALRATGSVPGSLLSQWAMDEYQGHLRVAYTSEDGTWRGTSNGVDVLDSANLSRVGRVDDLASGERIYAVRFAGAHGYLVTFRQVDPLFTLSLADPAAPKVLGELKIPGYSDYLHPVGADALLGIGKAGDDDGVLRGVKIALFDIADLAAPREVASVELGGPGSRCGVEDDHKALLYDAGRRLLVVPVTERFSAWACDDAPSFHGAKAYTLDASETGPSMVFTLRAAVEHGPNRSAAGGWAHAGGFYQPCAREACAAGAVRRAVRIGDELFTISDDEMRATSLTDWAETWRAPLHVRQPLATEGTCSLDGAPLPWARVAASSEDIYCDHYRQHAGGIAGTSCTADTNLSRAECVTYSARRTFDSLLSGARAGCGACATEFNACRLWF